MICQTWYDIVCRFAVLFGEPLPKGILAIGDADHGWGVELNNSDVDMPTLPRFAAAISWGGFPAGLCNANGGVIAAGEAANEQTFLAWLKDAAVRDAPIIRLEIANDTTR